MKKSLTTGLLAAAVLSFGAASAVLAAPLTLDQTGFAPSEPIAGTSLATGTAATRANTGGGTNGQGFQVNGSQGDMTHNNARTDQNAQYDFTRDYRFTGDSGVGSTQKTRQSAVQGMVPQTTETGLLSPPPGRSFYGGNSFGFKGSGGDMYHGIYNSRGFSGNPLPGCGTGRLDVNITDGY